MKKWITAIPLGLILTGIAYAEWAGVREIKSIETAHSIRFAGSASQEIKREHNTSETEERQGFFPTKEQCLEAMRAKHQGDLELDKKGMSKENAVFVTTEFPTYRIVAKVDRQLRQDKTGTVNLKMDSQIMYRCDLERK